MRALAQAEGLDLARCSAYSDSINDLPLLSLVGHPVAVNPDSALKAEARDRGWEIRDFRTGRKAARIGVPAALGVGAVAGGVLAGLAMRREHERKTAAAAAARPARPPTSPLQPLSRAGGHRVARVAERTRVVASSRPLADYRPLGAG